MNIIVALLIFTVIVVVHEFGHFLLAKKNAVGVPEFSVGMGPRIITFAKTKNGMKIKLFCTQKYFESNEEWADVTKYSWKILPIGGSCAMVGEDEENESEDSFNSKGKWARFSIVFAGPFFNFILAFIFSIIIIANQGVDYAKVEYLYDRQPAKEAGIKKGDIVKSINGHHISVGREIDTYLALHPLTGEKVKIVVLRDGKEKTFKVDPNYSTFLFGFSYSTNESAKPDISQISEDGAFDKAGIKVGDEITKINGENVKTTKDIQRLLNKENIDGSNVTFVIKRNGEELSYDVKPVPYKSKVLGIYASVYYKTDNVFEIIKYSFVEVKYWIETTVASIGSLITGNVSVKQLSGPVGIVDTVGSVIEESRSMGIKVVIMEMLYMSVLLSANLGVMNLLPLPALDGGRLVFIIIEAIRGKPVDKNKEGYVHFAGFILLMILMVFVMYNDIIKIIG